MNWIHTPTHAAWLDREFDRLLDFGRAAALPTGGFGWLDNVGTVKPDIPAQLWITARMTHTYAIAATMGRPGAGSLADHGVDALLGLLHDKEHGGWFASATPEGPVEATKAGYPHFFVLLAAASAHAAGRPRASDLLGHAIALIESRFWNDADRMAYESWDREFTVTEAYRGGNANMHAVEAFLAVADVTGDDRWLTRALDVSRRLIHEHARNNEYRVFEHFDESWNPLPDYNVDEPAHRFRAYGSTPGHWVEWSRLLLQLDAALTTRGLGSPAWLQTDAIGLFDAALRDAWSPDGVPGFVYSVDWNGTPVVRERIRWVIVEAIGGAYALHIATGEQRFATWYETFWDFARDHFIDHQNGSWWQELDSSNKVSNRVWDGKPDIYHLVHALVTPRLPLTPYLASATAQGLIDS